MKKEINNIGQEAHKQRRSCKKQEEMKKKKRQWWPKEEFLREPWAPIVFSKPSSNEGR